jgi:hypothetical protein
MLKPLDQLIREELTKSGLGLLIAASPSAVAEDAAYFEDIGAYKIPMLGGFTELESMLFKWIRGKQTHANVTLHLAELTLAKTMIEDLNVPDDGVKAAIATCLNWFSNDRSGEYRYVRWLIDHGPEIAALSEAANEWTNDLTRIAVAAIFLGCRVDAEKDWAQELVIRRNLLSDVHALIDIELGLVNPAADSDLESLDDLKKP